MLGFKSSPNGFLASLNYITFSGALVLCGSILAYKLVTTLQITATLRFYPDLMSSYEIVSENLVFT